MLHKQIQHYWETELQWLFEGTPAQTLAALAVCRVPTSFSASPGHGAAVTFDTS